MAIIDDPDLLQDSVSDDNSTNVFIDTLALTVKLNTGVGGLDARDGVVGKAVYSFIKEEWKNDPNSKNLAAFDFPFQPITDEFFELINGWTWADTTTEQTIRRAGWLVRNVSGGVTEHWAGTAILNAENDDQTYYDLGDGAVDYTFQGNTAEAIQVISDPNGDGNYTDGFDRSSNVNVYNREQGQLYSSSSSTGIGESSLLAPKLFSFALPTGEDLNISASDTDIQNNAPYTGMEIRFYPSPQSRTIGGVPYDFGVIIDGNNGSTQEIYEFVQFQLRQNSDIDVDGGPDIIGKLTGELLQFVGPNLETLSVDNPDGGGSGVYIDGFNSLDTNSISFTDNNGDEVTFPFVAGVLINNNLGDDPDSVYRAYYEDGVDPQFRFGQSGAIFVEDNSGNAIVGDINGNPSIARDYDYDGNNQGNRTPGTDANIIVIGIGLDGRQHIKSRGTITRASVNTITLTSSTERQYENPA
tara:strand:+ start:237 stop:1643 length:1407 start_codon:yes stop_codon:yes gene_type:complete